MDLALLVYGISVLAKLTAALGAVVIATAVFVVIQFFYWVDGYGGERTEGCLRRGWKAFWVGAFALLLLVALPNEKTAYTMVGAYAAQKVAENEKVQQMSGKVLQIIEQKLDGFIDEGLEEAKKKVTK